jgi:U3 small nucleolar RNA-associated protein 4
VSTGSEIRLFFLNLQEGGNDSTLKIRKINLPKRLADAGARLVQISPDSRWLLIAQTNNAVRLLRITLSPSSRERPSIVEKFVNLRRLPRLARHEKIVDGSLGNYDRTIHCASFSEDSRIVAVSDLSGYIDTWVLEGHEDLALQNSINGRPKRLSRSALSSSDADSSENESQDIIFGQRWLRNPAGALLPRLNAFPLFLSFRPDSDPSPKDQVNGAVAMHPTRHNPTPISHDLPIAEDRLLAVTSENHLIEFNALRGKLSEWSRRNPKQMLPSKYTNIRERALGCLWDVGNHLTRLWLYGHNFLCMFDMSRDFQTIAHSINGEKGTKRKREDDSAADPRKYESGAGQKKVRKETSGFGENMLRAAGPDLDSGEVLPLRANRPADSDDEEEKTGESALTRLRREDELEGDKNGFHGSHIHHGDESRPNGLSVTNYEGTTCWTTHRYRYILGLLPLASSPHSDGAFKGESDFERRTREVCIVERPTWDLDLPPRYDGDRDWDR